MADIARRKDIQTFGVGKFEYRTGKIQKQHQRNGYQCPFYIPFDTGCGYQYPCENTGYQSKENMWSDEENDDAADYNWDVSPVESAKAKRE
jgi:hypothetical protein